MLLCHQILVPSSLSILPRDVVHRIASTRNYGLIINITTLLTNDKLFADMISIEFARSRPTSHASVDT